MKRLKVKVTRTKDIYYKDISLGQAPTKYLLLSANVDHNNKIYLRSSRTDNIGAIYGTGFKYTFKLRYLENNCVRLAGLVCKTKRLYRVPLPNVWENEICWGSIPKSKYTFTIEKTMFGKRKLINLVERILANTYGTRFDPRYWTNPLTSLSKAKTLEEADDIITEFVGRPYD